MNAYDFDGTIFDGDSTVRFTLFLLGRDARLISMLPRVARAFLLWKLGKRTRTEAKQTLFMQTLPRVADIEQALAEFWRMNERHIRAWYLKQKRADDVIVSASPEFLLKPICEKLGVRLIASRVDPRTGAYTGLNCDGAEKTKRFAEQYREAPEAFYSDSLHDLPMARISRQAYLVRGDRIARWDISSRK